MSNKEYFVLSIFTILALMLMLASLTIASSDDVTLDYVQPFKNGDHSIMIEVLLFHDSVFSNDMSRSECELYAQNNLDFTEYYESYYNVGNGVYKYEWSNITNGDYTIITYCHYGDVLDQSKIYVYALLEVNL
jgi:hypothetical protein